MQNNRAAHVVIDRDAMAHNLAQVKALTPNARIMAVIKADAYGHNMEVAAQALDGADEFAVTSLDDVARLRANGISKPLTVLSSSFDIEQLNQMSSQNVRPVIYDLAQISELTHLSADAHLDIWLKLDTGMGRLGLCIDDAHMVAQRLLKQNGIASVSAMTHLANADTPDHPSNQAQIKKFLKFAESYGFKQLSLMNSAGCIAFSNYAQDLVRPGIMLYGISPQNDKSAIDLNLKPAMTFKSRLISIKRLPVGSPIGYGSTYALDHDSKIGVIACGYADGYPRHAPNGTPVLINGMYVPLIGRVSMDLIAVELNDIPAKLGDEAILWGEGNPVEDLAKSCGTIAYELVCGIGARVERIVV